MPLFNQENGVLNVVKQKNFPLERELQQLVENNLEEIFNCKFVASEFYTGSIHSGRIDTIAISEDNNPVIIEYKKEESSSLLNQSLYYLSWLEDHKGDFQMAVNKQLGYIDIDWSNIRVICIAPGYKKYDLHAVKVMNKSIELWKYKNFENGMFNLEEIFVNMENNKCKEKVVRVDEKETEKPVWTYERISNKLGTTDLKEFIDDIRDYTVNLSEEVEEVPQKNYVAYKIAKNFTSLECQKKRIIINLKFTSSELEKWKDVGRDVTNIGHFGTGNFQFYITEEKDLETAKELIKISFENVGG
ncbi:DUF5655 domain-containing protein [Psychrilyobacter atlanticus]|uniref:DUF5655 domain-containing protein n=1 Tax=Psychrilyobacter atlanticus TaxID=271091 RepID=UPI0003F791F8|nr:DUF5655 domain-containing protein [Psychrilyobacter atlanticus]